MLDEMALGKYTHPERREDEKEERNRETETKGRKKNERERERERERKRERVRLCTTWPSLALPAASSTKAQQA